tara:strand:- start:704 stop:2098 length:1395 start_codon:yes stop_codon:yes gene_type:complete
VKRTLDEPSILGNIMVDIPDIGQKVQIEVDGHNGKTTHEGVILHPAAPNHVTLKLVNGYNASYTIDEIVSIQVVGEIEEESVEKFSELDFNDQLPRVRIIHTGGTIASKVDYKTGAVVAKFEPKELVNTIPELAQIANIDAVKLGNMFSDDIRCQHWNKMIDATKQAFDDGCSGVVITHGTDTLHITSAAMCFAWSGEGQAPPGRIALVGSQRSSDRGSSDASENLISAVYWAANGPNPGAIRGDTAVVVMHTSSHDGTCSIQPGTGVRKLHSTRRDAFRNVNSQPLAYVNIVGGKPSIVMDSVYQNELEKSNAEVTKSPKKYSESVRIAQFIAGPYLHEEEIEAIVANGPQAIVIHGTGLGHLPIDDPGKDAPENTKVWRALTRCINRNIPVVVTSQCLHGPIDMNVYSKGRKQQQMGLLGHGSVTSPDSTIVKIHYALSNDKNVEDILAKNLCGENHNVLRE